MIPPRSSQCCRTGGTSSSWPSTGPDPRPPVRSGSGHNCVPYRQRHCLRRAHGTDPPARRRPIRMPGRSIPTANRTTEKPSSPLPTELLARGFGDDTDQPVPETGHPPLHPLQRPQRGSTPTPAATRPNPRYSNVCPNSRPGTYPAPELPPNTPLPRTFSRDARKLRADRKVRGRTVGDTTPKFFGLPSNFGFRSIKWSP